MRQISNAGLKAHFLGWQCRIRQISARDYGGQPFPAMRPRVSSRKGEVMLPAMTVLLVQEEPSVITAFFRFQIQKTNEAQKAREAGLNYLAGDFYQLPELFSDELTAVFGAGSETAAALVKAGEVLLDFEQYSQSFRMFCAVRRLPARSPAREASLWQSRLFNPNVPSDAVVLGFKPDWKNAAAQPMP
ncbi:MAG: hypothetical protein ACT4SY_07755 [Hyphomicrobiales bacterium]